MNKALLKTVSRMLGTTISRRFMFCRTSDILNQKYTGDNHLYLSAREAIEARRETHPWIVCFSDYDRDEISKWCKENNLDMIEGRPFIFCRSEDELVLLKMRWE